jgi:hypothetical protein
MRSGSRSAREISRPGPKIVRQATSIPSKNAVRARLAVGAPEAKYKPRYKAKVRRFSSTKYFLQSCLRKNKGSP